MTADEIAEFMGWSPTDKMREDSFVGRVHRLVAEVQRREREALKASVLPALQIGLMAAHEVAENYHAEMRGYRPEVHRRVDDEERQVREALKLVMGRPEIEGVPV